MRLRALVILTIMRATTLGASVLVFDTPLIGAMNQRLAVAERLSSRVRREPLPEPLRREPLFPLVDQMFHYDEDWPDIILHTEPWPHEIDFLFEIKRRSPKPVRIVHLEDPGYRRDEFDLIVNATHQRPLPGPNVYRPVGVPSRLSEDHLQAALETWRSRLAWLNPPRLVVALGGGLENHPYQPEFLQDLVTRLKTAKQETGGSLVIVTSRRTPEFAVTQLTRELTGLVYYLHDWRREPPEDNPYVAALGLADHVVVTGDSLSMMSDALALSKSLYIHAPPWSLTSEPPRMIEDLYIARIARPFTGRGMTTWSSPPLRVADQVAGEIRKRFCRDELGFAFVDQ